MKRFSYGERDWEVERGQCVHIMRGYAVSLYDIDWSPAGTQLASAGSDTLVTIWDVADQLPLRQLRGHCFLVYGLAWSPDGRLLASSFRLINLSVLADTLCCHLRTNYS